MKKGANPELDAKWWSRNKAKSMKKSGLGKELLMYETLQAKATARGQEDAAIAEGYMKTFTQLKKVGAKIPVAIKCCNPKMHADTASTLQKFPPLIKKEEDRLKSLVKTYDAKAKAGPAVPKQKVGSLRRIWSRNIGRSVLAEFKPAWVTDFKIPDIEMLINSDIEPLLKKEGDLITKQQMIDDANKLFDSMVSDIVGTLKKIDAATGTKPPREVDKLRVDFTPYVNKYIKSREKEFNAIPQARFNAFKKRKQQYRDYQIETGLNISTATLGTIGAAAGIVGSGGAGLALGIVALVRSVAALINELNKAAQAAETVGNNLVKDLNVLQKRYRNAQGEAKKSQGAQEVGVSALKGILGVDPPFIASLPKCDSNCTLWKSKVDGLAVMARKASSEIMKGLASCDKLDGKIKNAEDKKAKVIYVKLKQAQKKLDDALGKTSDLMARVNAADSAVPALENMLKALQSTNPKYAEIFDRVFPTVVNLGLSGAGAGVSFADSSKALDLVNTSLGLFNDIASEGKSQLEASLG